MFIDNIYIQNINSIWFFFLVNYFLLPFVILGYGLLSEHILLNKINKLNDLGLIGFFGLLFLYFLGSLFHFFTNITNIISYSVLIVGFVSFIIFFIQKKIDKNQLIILLLALIIYNGLFRMLLI